MKKLLLFILITLLINQFVSADSFGSNLKEICDKPFIDEIEPPPFLIEKLENIYGVYGEPKSIVREEIANRFDEKNPIIRNILSYEEFTIYYDLFQNKNKFYRTLFIINVGKINLKFNINENTKIDDLIELFGKSERVDNFDKNTNYCYSVPDGYYEIQFGYSNEEKLHSIFYWIID